MSNTVAVARTQPIDSDEIDSLLSTVRTIDYVDLLATYMTSTAVGNEFVHTIVTMEKIPGMSAEFTSYPVTRYTVHTRRFLGKFRKRYLKQVGFDVEFTYNDAAMQVQMQLDAAAGMVIR